MNFKNGISIIIPSWKNFKYLESCVNSIIVNSSYNHEIIVHLNEYDSDSLKLVIDKKIKYTLSSENLGVCRSLNVAYKNCTKDIIGYFNDDMFALPKWDLELQEFSEKNKCDESYILASTMIEPFGSNPCCVAPMNFGTDIENFQYHEVLSKLEGIRSSRHNIKGSTWPPNFISKKLWDNIGGYSEEYGIGFGSDPDLIAKAYSLGCRNFIGVGKSLVYHFQCKTTGKIKSTQLEAEQIFKNKFGIEMNDFIFNILDRGARY
jgi:glycosyltransferase involved in cell wall biosynthesis